MAHARFQYFDAKQGMHMAVTGCDDVFTLRAIEELAPTGLSLLISSPALPPLESNTYECTWASGETELIFLVPISVEGGVATYEAIFGEAGANGTSAQACQSPAGRHSSEM